MRGYIIILITGLLLLSSCGEPEETVMESTAEKDAVRLLEQVNGHIDSGDLKKALVIIPQNSQNIDLLQKRLFILFKTGEFEEAIKLAHSMHTEKKDDYAVLILAKIYFLKGYYDKFEKYWRLLPEDKYDDELENMLKTLDNMRKSKREKDISEATGLLKEAEEHYRIREYIEAELKLKRLIRNSSVIYEKDNRSMLRDIYFLMGKTGLKMNNQDDAIYYFKKAHETEDTHSDTLLELGDIFFKRERYQMALSYYRKAFEITKDIRTYGNIGICLINLNLYEDALNILKEVYKKQPENLNAIYNLFICHHYLDNTDEAIKMGEILIQKAPENSDISKNVKNLLNIIRDGEK